LDCARGENSKNDGQEIMQQEIKRNASSDLKLDFSKVGTKYSANSRARIQRIGVVLFQGIPTKDTKLRISRPLMETIIDNFCERAVEERE
jgi:hypothetical protein